MDFIQNFPFFCIIISMFSAIISFILPGKAAKYLHVIMVSAVLVMSLCILGYVCQTGESYTYMMGHYPAPWGNEIRIGILETLMAVFFSLIMLLSVLGGMAHIDREIQKSKLNLYFILLDLLMSSLLALIYTNDLFTAYVFIEINTISACGLIMIKRQGRTYVSALRYMIMSLVGSGLFLIGLTLLYSVTGQLLMSPAKEALESLRLTEMYQVPVIIMMILITVGLAIKSGLYPFHTWIPDAYGYTTPTSSAILSSLVSKGYIFLLIKIFYRVMGFEDGVVASHLVDILFLFGIVGMIMGSVDAIRSDNIRRMTSFSSVAQIGYIFMGIGLGTTEGIIAALFHCISHGAMKSLLFISISGLSEVSEGKTDFASLRGAGFRNKIAGAAFAVGAMSMIGMPLLTGFISKYLFATAATTAAGKTVVAWIVLAVSTILNTVYFMRTVLTIYTPVPAEERKPHGLMPSGTENFGTVGLIALNVGLGIASQPVIQAITAGIAMFG